MSETYSQESSLIHYGDVKHKMGKTQFLVKEEYNTIQPLEANQTPRNLNVTDT